jgi:hypothetical protein
LKVCILGGKPIRHALSGGCGIAQISAPLLQRRALLSGKRVQLSARLTGDAQQMVTGEDELLRKAKAHAARCASDDVEIHARSIRQTEAACYVRKMKKIGQAPNIAIAQLWVDMLRSQGLGANLQRYFLSSAAGDLPPDQCLPEIWVQDDAQWERAKAAFAEIARIPQRNWICRACGERVEGGFEQCWNCQAEMPDLSHP